jgi:transcriptional regulator with XRE-family HTH domain
MDDFKDEKERSEIFIKLFADILEKYPQIISQQQAAEICQVSVQTIREWEKSGDLPFSPKIDKLLHYHQIRLDDLLTCLYIKECLHDSESFYMKQLRKFYTHKYKTHSDMLLIRDVVVITGFGKTTVVNWMNNGRLKGYNRGRIYRIPKIYLIDFVCGSYYRKIIRKSKIQKADMQSFLEELKELKI